MNSSTSELNLGLSNSYPYSDFTLWSNSQNLKNMPYTSPKAFPLDGDGGGAGYGDDYGGGETMGYGKTREQMWQDQMNKYKIWQQQQQQTQWLSQYRQPVTTPITTPNTNLFGILADTPYTTTSY